MKNKLLVGLLVLIIVLSVTFTLKALTEEKRIWTKNKFGQIEQLAYEGGEIMNLADTIHINVIGYDVKIVVPDSIKTKRNQAAINRVLQIEILVDSIKDEFGL